MTSLPAFNLQDIWTFHTAYQILIGSAFVTMVINVTWFLISSLLNFLTRAANRKVTSHTVALGRTLSQQEYEKFTAAISGSFCLIVRFGTDEYIHKLASDKERYEGRLLLKKLPIRVNVDQQGSASFSLKLPIHRRLGTQFKCYVVVHRLEDVQDVLAMLNGCAHVKDAKQSDSQYKKRIYFLLDQFFVVDSIDGVKNNYVFPE